jgi:hypothetical protein
MEMLESFMAMVVIDNDEKPFNLLHHVRTNKSSPSSVEPESSFLRCPGLYRPPTPLLHLGSEVETDRRHREG